jgi:YidC/Oxa1 family membrane protein insertase
MMNKLALYVFPLGVVVGGPFLPIAIIIYWVANNIWTFGQQHLVFSKIEKEEEAKKQEVLARRAANGPAPGAKPIRGRKKGDAALDDSDASEVESDTTAAVLDADAAADSEAGTPLRSAGDASSKPRPGARPNSRPKKRKR